MSKEDQNKYLASLKEYRDWYAVLSTAENKGIQKGLEEAEKKIKKAQKEKEEAQRQKEKAQKEKEKAQKREKEAQKEREKAQKSLIDTAKLLLSLNAPIEIISKNTKLSIEEIENLKD